MQQIKMQQKFIAIFDATTNEVVEIDSVLEVRDKRYKTKTPAIYSYRSLETRNAILKAIYRSLEPNWEVQEVDVTGGHLLYFSTDENGVVQSFNQLLDDEGWEEEVLLEETDNVVADGLDDISEDAGYEFTGEVEHEQVTQEQLEQFQDDLNTVRRNLSMDSVDEGDSSNSDSNGSSSSDSDGDSD